MTSGSSPHVLLRRVTEADVEFVVAAEQDPTAREFIVPWSRERHLAALRDADIIHFLLVPGATAAPVGFVLLADVRSPHGSVEFRRLVVTERGAGYGRAAVRAVKRYAFEELDAHRLWLDVMLRNTRALALYASERFVREGTLRECLRTPAGYESLVVMSLLRREYRAQAADG